MSQLRKHAAPGRTVTVLTFLVAFVALAAGVPASAGPAPALAGGMPIENRIFLTARAPYGDPRALSALPPACGDTTHRDTLYLCFEPAKDESTMYGFSAEVHIYAQPGDTLGSFWDMGRGGANNGGLTVNFGPDESFPQPQPWITQGVGTAMYDRTPQSGRFRFLFAVPINGPGPVTAGRRYVLGRIVLAPRHAGLTGCELPVCLEWHTATVQYRAGEKVVINSEGSRWLPRGGPASECRGRIPAWRPK